MTHRAFLFIERINDNMNKITISHISIARKRVDMRYWIDKESFVDF